MEVEITETRRTYRAQVDESGVTCEGELVIARADLASGRLVERFTEGAVVLEGRHGERPHLLRVADRATALALLRALCLGPDQVVLDRRLPWARVLDALGGLEPSYRDAPGGP